MITLKNDVDIKSYMAETIFCYQNVLVTFEKNLDWHVGCHLSFLNFQLPLLQCQDRGDRES